MSISKKHLCAACNDAKHGVKSKRAVLHTCDKIQQKKCLEFQMDKMFNHLQFEHEITLTESEDHGIKYSLLNCKIDSSRSCPKCGSEDVHNIDITYKWCHVCGNKWA